MALLSSARHSILWVIIMFVFSINSSKVKIVLFAVFFAAAVLSFVLYCKSEDDTVASKQKGVVLKAGSHEQRIAFLSQFGWEIDEDPVEVVEVLIPTEFDETYTKYNEIQKADGFDLEKYKGLSVKRWTYRILNYPGYSKDSDCIRANILVYNDMVIGGDVCSIELSGFMHGFDLQDRNASANEGKSTETTATTTKKQG